MLIKAIKKVFFFETRKKKMSLIKVKNITFSNCCFVMTSNYSQININRLSTRYGVSVKRTIEYKIVIISTYILCVVAGKRRLCT